MGVTKKKPVKVPYRKSQRVTKNIRDHEILLLRERGHSYQEISDIMAKRRTPLSPQGVYDVVMRTLRNIRENMTETVENVRQMELDKLDRIEVELNKILHSRAKTFIRMQATDRLLKVQQRRSELEGLDKKEKEKTIEAPPTRIYLAFNQPSPATLPDIIDVADLTPPKESEYDQIPVGTGSVSADNGTEKQQLIPAYQPG